MRVAITGVAGFMGSHIADALLAAGHEVIGLDDLSGGFMANLPLEHPRFVFYQVDLAELNETRRIIHATQPQILYHLCANAREGASFFDPVDTTRRNLLAYVNALESAIATKQIKRVVLFSSMARWGDQTPPFTEKMLPKPIDIYSSNKVCQEQITQQLAGAHDFRWTIIVPRNVFGPRQNCGDRFRNVLGIWANQAMRHEPITIFGDGEQVRSFSYIENSLPCYVRCLNEADGEIISIGGARPVSINWACDQMLAHFQEYSPIVQHLPDRYGEAKQAWATIDKSVRLLGYTERISLEEGIAQMAAWAKAQGPQEWNTHELALINEKVPVTWHRKTQEEITCASD